MDRISIAINPIMLYNMAVDRFIINLFHLYKPMLDSWLLFDNSENIPRLIAKEGGGLLTVADNKLFEAIKNIAEVL